MSNIQFTKDLNLWPGVSAVIPTIIGQSFVESTTGDAETIDITGSKITVPKGHFSPGTVFRYTMAGTRTGTAGAATIILDINGTDVISVAIPTDTAVDWWAQFTIAEHTDFAHQGGAGIILTSATVLSALDVVTGTVNVSNQSVIKAQMTLANAADSVTCSYVLIECWRV